MKIKLLFTVLFIILIVSCTPVKYAYFDIEEGLENSLIKITEDSSSFEELREKINFTEKNSKDYEKAEKNNTLLRISINKAYSFEKILNTDLKKAVISERELHIPVTDFRNISSDTNSNEIISGKYKTDTVENINLPLKGLSFNKLYPDNNNYSLYRETRIIAEIPEKLSEKQRELLFKWLENIDLGINNSKQSSSSFYSNTGKKINSSFGKLTWVGATGDIMPARGVQDILIGKKDGKEKIFSDTLPVLRSFDLLIGNLEGPVTYHKAAIEKAYNFKFRHKVLGELKKAGFDYLSAVNNHCYDFEEQGFLDTLYNLNRYKIKTSGAGKTLTQALEPALFNINSTDFSILALADYPAEKDLFEGKKETEALKDKPGILWPSEAVYNAVKKMSESKGVSIVSVHGGFEWQNQPALKQKKLYRKLVDHGADIVIGSHPHVLQPAEVWNGSLIVYSLGNFIFPGMDETEYGEESMILSIGLYKEKPVYINYIPVNIDMKYLSIDKTGKILKRFTELNNTFSETKSRSNT